MKIKKFLTGNIGVWIVAGVCCLLWGSAFPCVKAGYRLFSIESSDTASIILFAGTRFALAGALTLIIFSVVYRKALVMKKTDFSAVAILALFQTVIQYIFFYVSLAKISGQIASVIQGVGVFVALFISCFLFKFEKMTSNKAVGSVIGFVGVVLISVGSAKTSDANIWGIFLSFLSTVSYSFSSAFMKKFSSSHNPAMLSGYQFLLGGVVLIVIGAAFGGNLKCSSFSGVVLLVYLAFVSAGAYSLWSILLKYNDVSKVAVCGFMTPVFGYMLSSLFSSESSDPGIIGIASLIFVASGIIIVNKRIIRKT